MENLLDAILNMFKSDEIRKVVISKPSAKSLEYKKISAEKKALTTKSLNSQRLRFFTRMLVREKSQNVCINCLLLGSSS